MRVLFAASEAAPLIKVGGLGDVIGSLPKALAELGVEVSLALPFYEAVRDKLALSPHHPQKTTSFNLQFDRLQEPVTVWQTSLGIAKTPVFLFENPKYLSAGEHKAFEGTIPELNRFLFFSKAVAKAVLKPRTFRLGSGPDIVHCHDWHTSLIPLLLKHSREKLSFQARVSAQSLAFKKNTPRTLLTIHNLSYQGIGPVNILEKIGLSQKDCQILKWDAQNLDINWLMEGIIHADAVNTVSPSYAQEILTAQYGAQLDQILQAKKARLHGILNGIDYRVFNPETDPALAQNYDSKSWPKGKLANKKALYQRLHFKADHPAQSPDQDQIPLFAFIGRLDPNQKGLDILYQTFSDSKSNFESNYRFNFVLLGTGDPVWEAKFKALESSCQPSGLTRTSINITFDQELARQIYAAADFLIIPSRFEPCGLIQMIAMRYGALPVAHAVGGLKDSIQPQKTGFLFEEYSSVALQKALTQACTVWHNKQSWFKMVEQAMKQDFSWTQSAKKYLRLYQQLAKL